MQQQKIEYHDGNVLLEGHMAYGPTGSGKRPAVLVAHDWSGCNEFARQKAEALAKLGYVGFALDMYGKGKTGKDNNEKAQLMRPFIEDRGLLRQRITAALHTVKQLANVDANRIGAIGFCFGGLCALDLARSGADVRGVVSFHGLLHAPQNLPGTQIKAKILVLHGHQDPLAPPEQVLAFQQEMTTAQADWQTHIYGNIKHAFTNPAANDQNLGLIYNKLAEQRSWAVMANFFAEVFQ